MTVINADSRTRTRSVSVTHADDELEQWYRVPASELRTGDYIRFVSASGRVVEGVFTRRGNGGECNFTRISPDLMAKWENFGAGPERKGLPDLSGLARQVFDSIERLSDDNIKSLAFVDAARRGEVFDLILLDMGHRDKTPWWAVWEMTRMRVERRARSLGIATRRHEDAASEIVCSAVVACYMEASLPLETRGKMVEGYRKALGFSTPKSETKAKKRTRRVA